MSYKPEFIAACRKVIAAFGLSEEDAALLAVAGPAVAGGQVSAQVPEPDVAAAVRMGWLQAGTDHDAGAVGRLVEDGYLAWKTTRGWNHDPEGRHAATGRTMPSRRLWMTTRLVEAIGPALHGLFLEGLESARAKAETGPPLLREGYRARHREGIALGESGFLERLADAAAPAPGAVASYGP